MKYFLFAVLILTCAGCRHRRHNPESWNTDTVKVNEVNNTLRDFNQALSGMDSTSLRKLTADDFSLIEDGVLYDYPGMIASLRQAAQMGTITRSLDKFHTVIKCRIAWTNYIVNGTFTVKGKQQSFKRIETAVLKFNNSEWRLVQITSQLPNE